MTIALADIARCFEGTIPAIIVTSSATGEPNLAHLSQVFLVDDEHVATSNQFFSKTVANLAANPLAVLLCPDPADLRTFKLLLEHERTEREGPLFETARASIDAIAALTGMADVFALRAVDVFRVLDVDLVPSARDGIEVSTAVASVTGLRVLGDRLAAMATLEDVVDAVLPALEELFGHHSSLLLVHEPELDRLVTLASHGYGAGGIGSEVALGQGVIGMAAARRAPMRIGNLQRMLSYARTVQRRASEDGRADVEIRLPGLADAGSQMAAPMLGRGVLLGVLAVESRAAAAYDDLDEQVLAVVAHLVAAALEREQVAAVDPDPSVVAPGPAERRPGTDPVAVDDGAAPFRLRHYAVDGSTFLDDGYVIKGVAGRLLWKITSEHVATGRTSFTNREAKLDPTLELPPYRDNFESRLILLKRRLAERDAPIRLTSSGRGRFELEVRRPVVLDLIARPTR